MRYWVVLYRWNMSIFLLPSDINPDRKQHQLWTGTVEGYGNTGVGILLDVCMNECMNACMYVGR
jgi:hypothetical protein